VFELFQIKYVKEIPDGGWHISLLRNANDDQPDAFAYVLEKSATR